MELQEGIVPWFYQYKMEGFDSKDPTSQSNRFDAALQNLMGVKDWAELDEYVEGSYEGDSRTDEDGDKWYDPGIVPGAERAMVLENFWGWDYVLHMPDGKLVISGEGPMISKVVYGKEELAEAIKQLTDSFPHHFDDANL